METNKIEIIKLIKIGYDVEDLLKIYERSEIEKALASLALPKDEQISILKLIITDLKRKKIVFICNYITSGEYINYVSEMASYLVPLFNFEHVTEICRKKHISIPVKRHPFGGGWWCRHSRKERIAVINHILKELETSK